ncbi:30S ribosomal protein S7 [Wolbachia endosymbiont of Diaphorina citri]|jgi:ribosomal protein S7, bacterial/organelle|uniref:30S ribosomal protein S7 n=1 Tax=unclassified Wolbachia TaxID=2640676 RepID=UPI00031C9AA3|nr:MULTISPECIES: 30S ribosomal protein S7 [unclassified Wolbachia]MCA7010293.1 30S ribosomal protein S7 [Wolbachia endosymbiont of Tribolium confusum]QJT94651.1 30S ribosomal protein S7 [Wolbachia endosymbiont of Diaphorina citri]QJT95890.1 30S ribosomal protein S7 [Wolbachia endosymbiont of Diaphorina citri]QJT97252.1 30S ribosomal protein S7 [Wolbachia endosymbiont of Diaphorina citri]QLK11548.1 30S ribosomal protein S7 [Wolbachia endosymbiont of Diaphorina citri]
MARRNKAKKRTSPDSRYGSVLLMRFINIIMKCGKKSIAEKIAYSALSLAEKKIGKDALSIFETAVENVTPSIEVRSRRIGGATYQVPVEIRQDRAISLALRWIARATSAARKKSGRTTVHCLQSEILDAYNKCGGAFKMCEEKYKMAEANKAFSHLRF